MDSRAAKIRENTLNEVLLLIQNEAKDTVWLSDGETMAEAVLRLKKQPAKKIVPFKEEQFYDARFKIRPKISLFYDVRFRTILVSLFGWGLGIYALYSSDVSLSFFAGAIFLWGFLIEGEL